MDAHIQGCLYLTTGKETDCHCVDEERHYWSLAIRSFASLIVQGSVGYFSNSLGLVADAAHKTVDIAENSLSAIIARKARTSANERILRQIGGFVSMGLIMLFSLLILHDALDRLSSPERLTVAYLWGAFGAGCFGLAIDIWQLADHVGVHKEHKNITHLWQWWHLVLDISGSVVAIGGLVAVYAGYPAGDTLASLAIVGLVWFRIAKAILELMAHKPRSPQTSA